MDQITSIVGKVAPLCEFCPYPQERTQVEYVYGCGIAGIIVACGVTYSMVKYVVNKFKSETICPPHGQLILTFITTPFMSVGGFVFGCLNAPFLPITIPAFLVYKFIDFVHRFRHKK